MDYKIAESLQKSSRKCKKRMKSNAHEAPPFQDPVNYSLT